MRDMPRNLKPMSPEDFWAWKKDEPKRNHNLLLIRPDIPAVPNLFQWIWESIGSKPELLKSSDYGNDLDMWIITAGFKHKLPFRFLLQAHQFDIADAIVMNSGVPFLPDYLCTPAEARVQCRWLADFEKENFGSPKGDS